MQSLKSHTSRVKDRVGAKGAALYGWVKSHNINWSGVINVVTILAFLIGIIALITLIWLYVRPLKLADIKVPVATDQSSYYPGEEISGIFFGEIHYRGEVRVLREIFCKDFHGIIVPPETARNGDFYDTQSIPRELEGLNVTIGVLPTTVPVGSNCVLQFTNVYNIQTPFGIRHVEYQYYTQNFSIVTRERRQQLECEATGRKDCNFITDGNAPQDPETPSPQSSPDSAPIEPQTNNTFNDNRTTVTNPPAQSEPAQRFEERCTVDFLGVKINCRQVPVN